MPVVSPVATNGEAAAAGVAEELEVENASSMRKQDMLFAILKELSEREVEITGRGVVEILQDGFGFLRSPESNYLPGPGPVLYPPGQSGAGLVSRAGWPRPGPLRRAPGCLLIWPLFLFRG